MSEDIPRFCEERAYEELALAKLTDDVALKTRHLNRAAYFAAAGERARSDGAKSS
ncbi:hypothetical protein N4G62_04660 [Sphingomonas sanguinis]|uniref:Uncharacterized protein n=1 Tax=Sphingomonas sanguinis TaxID=33051 RepID=A0ABU5LN12_9SPHN|nr:hypothetical protein [Sphingomonas sanguinis]MDZ7281318.1 hypothetical protein [Sphingomonas sanguinis]